MRYPLAPLAVLVLVTLSLAVLAADDGEDTLDLRLRLQKGDTYQFTTEIEKTVVQWVNDAENSEIITLALTQTAKVISVKNNGTARLRVTYDRVRFKCETEDNEYTFDSDNPPDEPDTAASLFEALVGLSYDVLVSPTGKASVQNTAMVHMALAQAMDTDDDEDDGHAAFHVIVQTNVENIGSITPTNEAMRMLGDDEVLKEHLAFLAVLYADAPVKVEDTWEDSLERAGQYAGTYETTYTLLSHADGTAEIGLAGTIEGNSDADKRPHGGIRISFGGGFSSNITDIKGTQKGTLKVDEASGLVREGTLSYMLKGKASQFNPMDPENLATTPMTVDIATTIKGKKIVKKNADDTKE